jgi:sugar lactone lactonase YvrE
MEILLDGLRFPECPRWHAGRLWFSDMLGDQILTLQADGTTELVVELERPGGLGFDPDGALIALSSARKPTLYRVTDGKAEALADLSPVARRTNDMVVDRRGFAYLDAHVRGDARVVLCRPGDQPIVVADGLGMPNGLAVTPDGSTLLVADTDLRCIHAFDIAADGLLGRRTSWADLPGETPDGICLDAEGAMWVGSYALGECIRVAANGKVTERLRASSPWATSCALGGEDGRTLFVTTADTTLDRHFAGDSTGWIEATTVAIAGVGCP